MRKTVFSKVLSVILTLAMVIACFPTLPVFAAGNTLTVDKSATANGTTIFNTIAEAVTAAADGDTINIVAGTYNEPMIVSSKTNLTIKGSGGVDVQGSTPTAVAGWDGVGAATGDYNSTLAIWDSTNIAVSGISFSGTSGAGTYDTTTILKDSTGVNIHNCTFSATSDVEGNFSSSSKSTCTLSSNVFEGETTRGIWFVWGGESGGTTIENNVIKNAKSIDISHAPAPASWTGDLTGDIIRNNTCLGEFTGARDNAVSGLTIVNNIFNGFTSTQDLSDSTIDYNLYTTATTKTLAANEKVVTDIGFKDASSSDYTLLETSPAIGAGDDTNMPTADFIGTVRVNNTVGAYEGATAPSTNKYTVDGTIETSTATTFKTLAEIPALNAGDTVTIKAGEYTDPLTLKGVGASSAPITITGESGAIISTTGGSPIVIQKSGTDSTTDSKNIIIKNLTLKSDKYVLLAGANNCKLIDCTFNYGSSSYGIYMVSATNCEVSGCTFNNVYYDPFYFRAVSGCKIYNNLSKGSKKFFYIDGTTDSNQIYNNTIQYSDTDGANATPSGALLTNNTIENNIFDGAGGIVLPTGSTGNKLNYNLYKGDALPASDAGDHSKFASDLLLNDDFTLQAGSPAIGAGDATTRLSTTDKAGVT